VTNGGESFDLLDKNQVKHGEQINS
ncbi:PTS glucose transporter subunit IIA, partial [Bifidobacterium adolescentis]